MAGNITTLSTKYQISIPKAVRTAQNWQPGDEFAFLPTNGGIMLVRVPRLEDLMGAMPNANPEGYRDRDDRY